MTSTVLDGAGPMIGKHIRLKQSDIAIIQWVADDRKVDWSEALRLIIRSYNKNLRTDESRDFHAQFEGIQL